MRAAKVPAAGYRDGHHEAWPMTVNIARTSPACRKFLEDEVADVRCWAELGRDMPAAVVECGRGRSEH